MILLQEKKSEALRTRDSDSVSCLAFRFVFVFYHSFAVSFFYVDSLDVMSFGAILVNGISRSRSTGFSQLELRGHDMCIKKYNALYKPIPI